MFTFERKAGLSEAPSPAARSPALRPLIASPVNPLWSRLPTTPNAGAAASRGMTEERRRYFEPRPLIQRKATISSPGDPYEREADEVADKVMRMADPSPIGSAPVAIQRKCSACEDEE